MKALTPFPHDASYDADFANGEIFDGNDDLTSALPASPRDHQPSVQTECRPVPSRYISFLESFGLL